MSKTISPPTSGDSNTTPALHWIGLAFFFAAYLGLTFFVAIYTGLWRFAQPYAELTIQHPSLVRVSTCILCVGCAWFLFWPREGGRFIGRWSDYVGLAFAMFAVQYAVRLLEMKLEANAGHVGLFHYLSTAVIYITSSLNNLFLYAAARVLLRRNKIGKLKSLSEDAHRILSQPKVKLLNFLAEFWGAIPVWALIWAILAQIALLDSFAGLQWVRFIDAIFSVFCLSWLGYAIAVNLNMRRRKVLAATSLIIALLYGGAQLIHAMNPIIASTATSNQAASAAGEWLRTTIGTKVVELTNETNAKTGRKDDEKAFLDNAVYAMLLPMKLALFFPAFSLYLLFFINSFNDMVRALFESINRRKDYLSSDGIVDAIATAIGAEQVILYIRIPGMQELPTGPEERALPLEWYCANGSPKHSKAEPVSIRTHPELTRIMKQDGLEIIGSDDHSSILSINQSDTASWWEPIKFHGGVIGALQAVLVGDRKNHTTLQKFRLMTDLIAPSVQDYRSLAAMDQLGFRFTRLQVDHPKDVFEVSTMRMGHVLYDVLSPVASGLIIDFGFAPVFHFDADSKEHKQFVVDLKPDVWPEDEEIQTIGDIMLAKSTMVVRTREQDEQGESQLVLRQIGGLMLAIPAAKDEPSRPTLAAYYLNRKAVASLMADGVLDLARDSLGEIIKELGVELNKEPLSKSTWFMALQSAVQRSGIRWVVASPAEHEEQPEGQPPITLDPDLTELQLEALFAEPLATLHAADLPVKHIIRLVLPKSKYRLFLGIERTGFGPELNFDSPWRVFLSDLAKVSDAALDVLKTQQAVQMALENENVITIALLSGAIMHQVLNLMDGQLYTTTMLAEESRKPTVQLNEGCERFIQLLLTTASQGRDLTQTFRNVGKSRGERPCSLKRAAEEAVKLHKYFFKDDLIDVIVDPSTDIAVDVPFLVAVFALANLISNAKDAIWKRGWIKIEAVESDQSIHCHVTNNGFEIPAPVQETLFEFGQSSKDGHYGWGLHFVKKTLMNHSGDICLAHTNATSTRFTIDFPRKPPARDLPIS